MSAREPGARAPLIVFGTIIAIAATGVTIVLVNDCRREQPYQDADWVRPGSPPPPSLPPPPDRPRPKPPAP